jgi:hypothetical protein
MRQFSVALLLMMSPLLLCAADPAVGIWNMNLAKSKYTPGPPPRSQTRIYVEEKAGLKAVVITVYKDGNTETVIYPATYDGKEHPVSGAPDRDGIVMTRIDEYTAESILTHAGVKIGEARRTVSRDGRTMTVTYKGVSNGETVNNTAVYEKVPD